MTVVWVVGGWFWLWWLHRFRLRDRRAVEWAINENWLEQIRQGGKQWR